jgi:hypothetical protein
MNSLEGVVEALCFVVLFVTYIAFIFHGTEKYWGRSFIKHTI